MRAITKSLHLSKKVTLTKIPDELVACFDTILHEECVAHHVDSNIFLNQETMNAVRSYTTVKGIANGAATNIGPASNVANHVEVDC
jgi:hypothetical protein